MNHTKLNKSFRNYFTDTKTDTKKVFTPVQVKVNGQWSKKQGARKCSCSSL